MAKLRVNLVSASSINPADIAKVFDVLKTMDVDVAELSVRSASRPSNDGASMSRYALNAGSMLMTRWSMPRLAASAAASSSDPWLL